MTFSRIVVDSSAIVAILTAEPEREPFIDRLNSSGDAACSMVSFLESFMVSSNRRPTLGLAGFIQFLEDLGIKCVALDQPQATLAAEAFLRFGKGRHPAKLNLGDCFSYALAKSLQAPLLYKGEDFGRTDIASALAAGAPP